jgi:ketosteroid isomerase-like protein
LSGLVRGALTEATRVEITRSGETVEIRGEEATVSGQFSASYASIRESRTSPRRSLQGEYSILWRREDGNWKIVSAQGGDSAQPNAAASEPLF